MFTKPLLPTLRRTFSLQDINDEDFTNFLLFQTSDDEGNNSSASSSRDATNNDPKLWKDTSSAPQHTQQKVPVGYDMTIYPGGDHAHPSMRQNMQPMHPQQYNR